MVQILHAVVVAAGLNGMKIKSKLTPLEAYVLVSWAKGMNYVEIRYKCRRKRKLRFQWA
jgi:hypothetical protein